MFHRRIPRFRLLAAAALLLLAGLVSHIGLAVAQQLDSEVQKRAIIAHLNGVIQFYRTVTQPIQKAGEPNDVVYRDQAVGQAAEIARYAFQSAKAEAPLLAATQPAASTTSSSGEQQRIQATAASVDQRITDLHNQITALDQQITTAKARDLPALRAQRQQLEQALDLSNAMKQALDKITSMAGAVGGTGLLGDVDRLQQSVPELQSSNKTSVPQITTVDSALSSGVTTQASVLFDLLSASHTVQALLHQDDVLHQQAVNLRAPLTSILRTLIQQGNQLTQQAQQAPSPSAPAAKTQPAKNAKPAVAASPQAGATHPPSQAEPQLQSITTHFKALAAATVPLSQEIILLEQSRANLAAWQTSLISEYKRILHSLLLRILIIGIALVLITGGGQIWTRATNKYVHDIRRRRQLLIVRRVVVGFLSALVVLFGFVTQFHSLATFAGFITAGIAVGLQTILLSVAAYFFIIGRYGIKVGDRITIAAVTGDVIDVGLVRFYVMELAGSGPELKPTGRVVVFSNAVLFQAGTPLYKQLPGTDYAWHELIVKLTDAADYKLVCEAVVKEIRTVYETYRSSIFRQHQVVQNWMETSLDSAEVESRLQFTAGAFQLWARFPVEIRNAAATDEKITRALLDLIAANPAIKSAIASPPTIQASVRG